MGTTNLDRRTCNQRETHDKESLSVTLRFFFAFGEDHNVDQHSQRDNFPLETALTHRAKKTLLRRTTTALSSVEQFKLKIMHFVTAE
jgi:hypothetical protein